LYTDADSSQLCLLVGETLGQAIIDTGCPHTVTGDPWLQTYLDTLSRKDRLSIRTQNTNNKFRFGDGTTYSSKYHMIIPVYIGRNRYKLGVDVVDCNIPLLLSRTTLKRANATIDIGAATICFFGNTIPLIISSSGHMCLPISRLLDTSNEETKKVLTRVLFTSPIDGIGSDLTNKAKKLHLQFCHPTSDRLIQLIKNAGATDQKVFDSIKDVTAQCNVCIRNRRAPLKPVVGFPLASEFNETVAMDLKSRGKDGYILHFIDHLTRYSNACIITNKRKETIIRATMDHWVRIFGSPKYFLTDNGGEFVNKEFLDFAEKFNIVLKTTAAEAPWSNGLCERHNGILNNNVNKILESNVCSLDIALAWAISAKNSLANVYGFSPNMLVFGRNPNFPTSFTNKPPANNPTCLNDYVTANLNAMHVARTSFIKQESCERLRRALNRKSRTYSNNVYCQGDRVFYWRNDQLDCHGPAVVIGKDGQQVLLKHSGMYIRVHPCRMQPCNPLSATPVCPEESTSRSSNPDNSPCSSEDSDDAYTTADEDEHHSNTSSEEFTNASSESIVNNSDLTAADSSSGEWTQVTAYKDLPKNGSTIECLFPEYENKIKCKILSRAGKTTTANWHFLNVQEDNDENGKCCTFKNAKWRPITDDESSIEPVYNELFFGHCDAVFDAAKQDEIQKWKTFKTFIEIPDNGEKTISTRWVCTRKIKGGVVVYKARLVARGFEENSKLLQTDSPTCSKESLRIVLTVISSKSWKLHSMDIKSAFLQGAPMKRNVLIKPPREANTSSLWKMIRCPYGLADAGRHWYLRLKNVLIELGMSVSKYDQALFTWHHDGQLSGVMTCHVDDIVYGGSQQFHNQIIHQLKSTFVIGLEEDTNLKYLGLIVTRTDVGIKVSTTNYASSLKEISLPNNKSTDKEFSPEQIKVLKQFCGQMNWISTQGRPDVTFESCFVANSLKTGDQNVFRFANKIIRKVQNQDVTLNFPRGFDLDSCSVVSFCDASFANLPNAGSQGSFVVILVDSNGLYCPIAWQSRKIRRVVKSTLAAECLAAVEAAEMTVYIASVLKDISQCTRHINTIVYSDNKNLVNSVHSSNNLEEKRLLIDISILRDMLAQHELTEFKWVPTEHQLANALTKQGASDKLLISVFNDTCLRFNKHNGYFE
jgi:transposase InsO family protein